MLMPASITQILHMSRSGMLARLLDLDVVSHNLANVNTIGYKATRSNFQELLNQAQSGPYAHGSHLGGTGLAATQRFLQQGSLRLTGGPLDLAVSGEGLFAVTLPDGRRAYTRDGQFTLDANRRIVNANGYPLVWQGTIPADALQVQVTPEGQVFALQGQNWNQVGTIQLTRFPNPQALESFGENLWIETPVSGAPISGAPAAAGNGKIVPGALEQSNVNLGNEMAQMVTLQRSFQMSLRSFQQTDQMLAQALQMRRG
jgi:flagellar basal-body rod protein FlgG